MEEKKLEFYLTKREETKMYKKIVMMKFKNQNFLKLKNMKHEIES